MAKLGGVTYQAELPEKPQNMKKNKIAWGRLGLIVRLDSIWLNGLT